MFRLSKNDGMFGTYSASLYNGEIIGEFTQILWKASYT